MTMATSNERIKTMPQKNSPSSESTPKSPTESLPQRHPSRPSMPQGYQPASAEELQQLRSAYSSVVTISHRQKKRFKGKDGP